jgi:hypothetical protein
MSLLSLFDWNILTPTWRKECGAFGWDETKHDILDRAQLRCEIDALVARLYGLNKQELEYILSTFPIVREKTPWLIEGTMREFERIGDFITDIQEVFSNTILFLVFSCAPI